MHVLSTHNLVNVAFLSITQLYSLLLIKTVSLPQFSSLPPSLFSSLSEWVCNSSICRGPSVLHLELQKYSTLLKPYTWNQSTQQVQLPVNYDFIRLV